MARRLNKIKLTCPKCQKQWAILSFSFNSILTKKNFKPLIKKYKLTDKDNNLYCTNCKYQYKYNDILIDIAKNIRRDNNEKKV